MNSQRLDKIISDRLSFSRSELKKMAKDRRIELNGETVTDLSVKADSETDVILVDGKRINGDKYVYIMLNKPAGVLSASDGKGEKTVIDLLPDGMKRSGLFPAGRLDKDTTGFTLITDDGDFAHRILSPKNHVSKTYIAELDKAVDQNGVIKLESGITLKDGTAFLPAEVTLLNEEKTSVQLTICEGKFHEVKRMFKAIGCEVLKLRRVKIGALALDEKLKPGEARYISSEEIKLIEKK